MTDQTVHEQNAQIFADFLRGVTNAKAQQGGVADYARGDSGTQDQLTATKQKVAGLYEKFEGKVEQIRNRGDLTPEAKRSRIARLYQQHVGDVASIRQQLDEQLAGQASRAKRELFSVLDLTHGHDVSAAIQLTDSFRNACDRAEQIDNPNEALAMLARAEETGDEMMARAIARQAGVHRALPFIGGQWDAVLHAYVDGRPAKAAALQQFDSSTLTAVDEGHFFVAQPREVHGMSDAMIDTVARQFDAA